MELIAMERELFGTKVWIKVFGEKNLAEKSVDKAFMEFERIERKYSRFLTGNELAELNARVGKWTQVSPEFYNLIKFGCEMKKNTDGVFDLSVKSILESWGYDKNYSFEIKEGGEVGDIETGDNYMVKIDSEIELGGLGKGYSVDCASGCLRNFKDLFINAGGDIFAKGHDVDGRPWRVLFEHPTDVKQAIGFVEVDGFALACTSPSKRKWGDKHHLVDPRIKKPAHDMLAVYTQAKTCLIADSYATALFVLGYEAARKKLKNFPVEAMLIATNGEIYKTKEFCGELFMANA